MIPSLPRSKLSRHAIGGYVVAFFVFLFVPLVVVAVFAFNDANYPAPPWRGFTLDWFLGGGSGRTGLFADGPLVNSVGTSVIVGSGFYDPGARGNPGPPIVKPVLYR